MSARPYHKRYHSDALAGFMSLTLEERGAYQTLLDLIYDRGGPIPDNERLLAGYMGVSIRKWRVLLEDLIAKRKILRTQAGELTNLRAQREIENDAKTSRKLAENGSKGGRNRAENRKNANENNESDQARLKPGSSLTNTRVREDPNGSSTGARAHEAGRGSGLPSQPIADADVVAAAGFAWPLSHADKRQLAAWANDGIDRASTVLPVIRRVAAERRDSNDPPSTLRYFDRAVRAEHAEAMRELEYLENVRKRPLASGGGL